MWHWVWLYGSAYSRSALLDLAQGGTWIGRSLKLLSFVKSCFIVFNNNHIYPETHHNPPMTNSNSIYNVHSQRLRGPEGQDQGRHGIGKDPDGGSRTVLWIYRYIPLFPLLLSIVSITFLISFRSIYLKHAIQKSRIYSYIFPIKNAFYLTIGTLGTSSDILGNSLFRQVTSKALCNT